MIRYEDGTMGPLLKKEVYTNHQPDGTIVTKTVETRTVETTGDFDFIESELNCVYCCTPIATLRLVQIIVGFIVIGCVVGTGFAGPYVGRLGGQTYVLVVACVCIIITFIILLVYLFAFHTTIMEMCPCRIFDLIYSIIAILLYFIAGIVECWYASGAWEQGALVPQWWTKSSWACRQGSDPNQYQCPVYIPWVIAAGFCFVNVLLYAIGAVLAALGKYYL